ncbi:hypothetical protein [Actinomadura sp. J1-007]|uniref:hypothetical protein n=1 Tax=Actinomadura sp. J1-007 TaxID=2661913 RepID=UPI00136B2420|nr:hypothetical protein [Actinomadura sp. J1-007]
MTTTDPVPAYPFGDWGFELTPQHTAARAAPAPACRVTTVTGDPAWLVTRHEVAVRALSDPRLSMPAALAPGAPRQEPLPLRGPEGTGDVVTELKQAGLHQVVADALGPRTVRRHQDWTTEQARLLLGTLVRGGPPADLHAGLALRLPFAVACRTLLGDLETDELTRLNTWADAALSWGRDSAGTSWRTCRRHRRRSTASSCAACPTSPPAPATTCSPRSLPRTPSTSATWWSSP